MALTSLARATSYSNCLALAVAGAPQRGTVHSVFQAAANITFPNGLVLSLNAANSTRMPNGLQLSTPAGTFPFSVLRVGMPVLLGAQHLHIEAANCSLDLSHSTQWDPQIERPAQLDIDVMEQNGVWLAEYVATWHPYGEKPTSVGAQFIAPCLGDGSNWFDPLLFGRNETHRTYTASHLPLYFPDVLDMAQYLCGRGPGLTPTGDDILAGWIAINWLLHGPTPAFLAACQQIITVARQQTHLLSQCWLGHATEGNVAEPIRALLKAMTQEDDIQFASATQTVLSIGATSGYDIIQGILLGLFRQAAV